MMQILKILKNHPKKIIFLIVFSIIQYLNFTGFCYSERRYLSEEELLKRGMGKIYEKNPDCCGISSSYELDYNLDYFLNNFFGRHLFGLSAVYKREEPLTYDFDYPYYSGYYYMNSCGEAHFDYGETIKEGQY